MLISFCAGSLSFPIASVEIQDKDRSTPFPCQDCPCGCKTAEQCWTSCCCHSPSERLAWAKKHGVKPPSYARLEDRTTKPVGTSPNIETRHASNGLSKVNRSNTSWHDEGNHYSNGCCKSGPSVSQRATVAACSSEHCPTPQSSVLGASASTKSVHCTACASKDRKGVQRKTASKVVLGFYALKCQGKSIGLNSLPWTILVSSFLLELCEVLSTDMPQLAWFKPTSVFLKPDTPPPRRSA